MSTRSPLAYVDAVLTEVTRVADAVRGVDPETTVPTCPEWTVADLVKHTGTVHRWAGQMVRDLATERLDPSTIDRGLPDDPRGYADWLAVEADPIVDHAVALRGTDARKRWLIVLQPGGWDWGRRDGEATVTASGAVDSLMLLLYGRRMESDSRLAITGDQHVLEFWLERSVL
jgi:hypothetical protein